MTREQLARAFNEQMAKEKRWFKYSDGTTAAGFIRLVHLNGGHLGAIKHCINNPSASGFTKLFELGDLRESCEYYVAYQVDDSVYQSLFSEEEKNQCRSLLKQYGF